MKLSLPLLGLSLPAILRQHFWPWPSHKACRCLSSDPCWPDDYAFERLASKLSQPLVRPSPPESACYPVSHPSGNCSEVTQNNLNGIWRATKPGSMQNPNYESYFFPNLTISACYLNTKLGALCEQGSVPVIGVDARTVSDVQVAVSFAKKHNLRVVVKSTGLLSISC